MDQINPIQTAMQGSPWAQKTSENRNASTSGSGYPSTDTMETAPQTMPPQNATQKRVQEADELRGTLIYALQANTETSLIAARNALITFAKEIWSDEACSSLYKAACIEMVAVNNALKDVSAQEASMLKIPPDQTIRSDATDKWEGNALRMELKGRVLLADRKTVHEAKQAQYWYGRIPWRDPEPTTTLQQAIKDHQILTRREMEEQKQVPNTPHKPKQWWSLFG